MHNIENDEHLLHYISKHFERVNWTHNYNTRHSNKGNYVLPKIRTEMGKNPKYIVAQRFGKKFHWISNQNLLLLFKKNTPIV